MFDWTDAAKAELKTRWQDGESASQIAAAMNLPSRSAAIGKAHRLGLAGTQPHSRPGRPPKHRKTKFIAKPPTAPQPPVEPVILPEPTGLEITFMQLEPHHCRYPSGEGRDILFCGATAVEDAPYCQFHSRVCYQPAKGARA